LKVIIRLFAAYRDKAGTGQFELELPSGATVGQAARELVRCYPGIAHDALRLVAAVNQEYADHNRVLKESDEVAFIPPVSGGSHD